MSLTRRPHPAPDEEATAARGRTPRRGAETNGAAKQNGAAKPKGVPAPADAHDADEPEDAMLADDAEALDLTDEEEAPSDEVEARGAGAAATSPVGDSIAMYLNEIGADPLLTAGQEVKLARKVRELIEIEKAKDEEAKEQPSGYIRTYTVDEERIRREGEQARARLVRSNLRLVVSIAKKYVNRGLSLLDLIQEGNIGLMRAVERFDPEKGFRFSTYATWWIRQAILRALAEKARMIRIPEYMVDAIGQYQREAQRLAQRTGREPSPEEVALALDMDPQRVRDLVTAIQQPASLEMPVGQEGESTLGEYIPDERTQSPEEAAVVDVLRSEVELALDRLDPREKQVLQLRYGLDSNGRPHTLEEVARKFKLTRERIRQIESRALRKMRTPERANKLRDFMQER